MWFLLQHVCDGPKALGSDRPVGNTDVASHSQSNMLRHSVLPQILVTPGKKRMASFSGATLRSLPVGLTALEGITWLQWTAGQPPQANSRHVLQSR